jgi:pimeloyl-ACP methyl ester carboxylesterase
MGTGVGCIGTSTTVQSQAKRKKGQGQPVYDLQRTLLRLPDRRNLEVFVSGPVAGPVLLFHQGTPGNSLRELIDAARTLGLRFVTTWRPGYGESTRQPGRSVAAVAADTEAVLTFLGVGRCLVAGWSGGGPRALACGAVLPSRVAAVLVIASPAPYGGEGLDFTAGMSKDNVEGYGVALQGEAADRPAAEAARFQMLSSTAADLVEGMGEGLSEADRAAITEEIAEDTAANIREALRVSADGWLDDDLSAVRPWGFDVGEVTVPTTLWHGTGDRLVPVTHGQWLAAKIPDVVAHFEEGEGHASISMNNMDRMLRELVTLSAGRL